MIDLWFKFAAKREKNLSRDIKVIISLSSNTNKQSQLSLYEKFDLKNIQKIRYKLCYFISQSIDLSAIIAKK